MRCIDGIFRGERGEDLGPYITFEELDIGERIEFRAIDPAHGDFRTPAEWTMCLASTFLGRCVPSTMKEGTVRLTFDAYIGRFGTQLTASTAPDAKVTTCVAELLHRARLRADPPDRMRFTVTMTRRHYKAKLVAGPLVVAGPLEVRAARRTLQASEKKLEECYLEALARNGEAEGTARLRFVVDEIAEIEDASIESSIDDAAMRACMIDVVKRAEWTAPTEGRATVDYEIELRDR